MMKSEQETKKLGLKRDLIFLILQFSMRRSLSVNRVASLTWTILRNRYLMVIGMRHKNTFLVSPNWRITNVLGRSFSNWENRSTLRPWIGVIMLQPLQSLWMNSKFFWHLIKTCSMIWPSYWHKMILEKINYSPIILTQQM